MNKRKLMARASWILPVCYFFIAPFLLMIQINEADYEKYYLIQKILLTAFFSFTTILAVQAAKNLKSDDSISYRKSILAGKIIGYTFITINGSTALALLLRITKTF